MALNKIIVFEQFIYLFMIIVKNITIFFYFTVIPYSFKSIRSSDRRKVDKAVQRFNNEMSGCIKIRFVENFFEPICDSLKRP